MTNENQQITTSQQNTDAFSRLTDAQWRYVTAMVENPSFNKKQGAEYIGIKPNTVYGWEPHVDEAIEIARMDIHRAAIASRRQALLKAIAVKRALLDSDDESIRSKAASEIIEWELGRASQRNEVTGKDGASLTIRIEHDAADDYA